MRYLSFVVAVGLILAVTGTAGANTYNWVAYNDCVAPASGGHVNITYYRTHTDDSADWMGKNPTGLLKNIDTGASTTVTATMVAFNISPWQLGAEGPGMPNVGTDAYSVFFGKVNIDQVSSYYLTGPGSWYYEVTFTGLDPTKQYEFVTTANRNKSSYGGTGATSRWTEFSIIGADAYANESTPGVVEVSEGVLKMNTGYNTVNGHVIRWTGITAADGSFTIRSQNVGLAGPGEAIKAYGVQAFMLAEYEGTVIPEPVTVVGVLGGLLGLGGYLRRRRFA